MIEMKQPIGRPRQVYMGMTQRRFISFDERK
jgi:citrate synthase